MNEQIAKALAQILIDNMGNKITLALANGIVAELGQRVPKDEDITPTKAD
jgi:hypothetical protein